MANAKLSPPKLTYTACDQIVSAVRSCSLDLSNVPKHRVDCVGPLILLMSQLHSSGHEAQLGAVRSWLTPDTIDQIVGAWSSTESLLFLNDKTGALMRVNKGATDDDVAFQFKYSLERAATAAGLGSKGSTLVALVDELMDNVKEHSGSPRTGYAVFLSSPMQLEVIVADEGRGVLNSLKRSPRFKHLSSDIGAMEVFTDEGVTSRFEEPGRGLGFRELPRVVGDNHGYARFHSGEGRLNIDGRSVDATYKVPEQVSHYKGLFSSLEFETRPVGAQLSLGV